MRLHSVWQVCIGQSLEPVFQSGLLCLPCLHGAAVIFQGKAVLLQLACLHFTVSDPPLGCNAGMPGKQLVLQLPGLSGGGAANDQCGSTNGNGKNAGDDEDGSGQTQQKFCGKTTDQQVLASWLFVKFLCTNIDFQAEFSMTSGYMPVLKSVTNNDTYAAWLASANGYEHLVAKCVQVGIDGRDNYFVSPAFNGSSTAREQVGALMLKCLSGEAEGDAAVDKLIDDAFQDALNECEY